MWSPLEMPPMSSRLRPAAQLRGVSVPREPLSHLGRAAATLRGRETLPLQLEGPGDPWAHGPLGKM